MKKNAFKLVGLLLLLSFVLVFTGCENVSTPEPYVPVMDAIEVEGTWVLDSSSDSYDSFEKWVITGDSISYLTSSDGITFSTSYSAAIVECRNGVLNGGDTSITPSGSNQGLGYAIIQYTEVNNAGTGEVGKFNVFRWASDGTAASLYDFTQGSKDSDLDEDNDPMTGSYVNLVFDSLIAAKDGATNEAGYFGFVSEDAHEPLSVIGTWTLDGSSNYGTYIEKWEISDFFITYSNSFDGSNFSTTYSAKIKGFSNNGLNGNDNSITASGSSLGLGHAIIQFTEVNNAGTGEVGKFNVFRWAQNTGDDSLRDFTQGSKDSNLDGDNDPMTGNYVNLVFDTAAAAEAGANNAEGFFSFASTGAAKE